MSEERRPDTNAELANEGTYLAWLRTGLALAALGVAAERVAHPVAHQPAQRPRPRTLSTTAGDLRLRISKLRTGSFFPALLDRRRRVDQALFAVIMEAYLHGVSTRKVDDLVQALGVASGISKSEVSRICAELDDQVAAFRARSLSGTSYPYVFLDATYCKARVDHQVVSQAVVVAIGVRADGREVLGVDVASLFWLSGTRASPCCQSSTGLLQCLPLRAKPRAPSKPASSAPPLRRRRAGAGRGVILGGGQQAGMPDRFHPPGACAPGLAVIDAA